MSAPEPESYTETLAAEVAGETEEWPPEWPTLKPVIAMPRRVRADVLEAYSRVIELLPALQSTLNDDSERPADNAGRAAWETYARSMQVKVTTSMTKPAIIEAVDAHQASDPARMAAMTRRAAQVTRLAGDLVDVLLLVADEPAAFTDWSDKAPDMEILTLFGRYARRTSLPEAFGSAT